MLDSSLAFSRLSFGYPSAIGLLFEELNCVFPSGWTGVVGCNGGGKTTLLRLAVGELTPDSGRVNRSGRAFLCRQEGFEAPPELSELIASPGRHAARLRDALGIRPDWEQRWPTLSFGERKRAQIGCALLGDYDILCLDEPTNHLDRVTRARLTAALEEFAGIGLLVSHDRELLDTFPEQCLFIEPGLAVLRPGNYSAGRRQRDLERDTQRAAIEAGEAELKRLRREWLRRREKEEAARGKDCKRKLDRHDHDGKGRIDAARLTGRDATAGSLAGRQRGRMEEEKARLAGLGKVKDESHKLELPYGVLSRRNRLFLLPPGREGWEGGGFTHPELSMAPDDRVGVTGGNGAGKSTLIRKILAGTTLEPERILYLPQELPPEEAVNLRRRLDALSHAELGKVMRVIHNLGSPPERVLESKSLSPGELRKLFLALGVNAPVELLVMDEPTNHLDLPSVECLETALAEVKCALLLVSHDRRFLEALCRTHWRIEEGELKTGFF